MTKVEAFYEGDTFKCSIHGHAGYANIGEDIVCSSVSILSFSLLEYLAQAEDRGLVSNLSMYTDEEAGCIDITCNVNDEKTLEAIRFSMIGFEILDNNFNKYVNYSPIGRDSDKITY